jgi:hypothetical protein
LSVLCTGRLYPQEIFLVLISVKRMSQPQGHSAAGRIMSMKNSSDTIGNRCRDLPVCSAVPQPLRHQQRAPPIEKNKGKTKQHTLTSRYGDVWWSGNNAPILHVVTIWWSVDGTTALFLSKEPPEPIEEGPLALLILCASSKNQALAGSIRALRSKRNCVQAIREIRTQYLGS